MFKKTILISLTLVLSIHLSISCRLFCDGQNISYQFTDSVISKHENVTDTIDVNAYYFKKSENVNTSFINTDNEEIRRSPGAMEDVIRYFSGSTGVSVGSDINNEIIVRGGSPVENLTIIDGLVIQNPNHYGSPGSTNGLLSYINLKMVKDVDFLTGGFPAEYGDRLSSVMDIKLKEGDRKIRSGDVYVSATGFGGFFEGPFSKRSSYMFSVRRSYYELIKKYLNTELIPAYWDFNTKLSFDLSSTDKLNITSLFATDNASPFEEGDFMYDTINVKILSLGINYKKELKGFTYSVTGGYCRSSYDVNYQDFLLNINDNEFSVFQKFELNIDKNYKINFFTNTRNFVSDYNVYHGSGFNASNYFTPQVSFNDSVTSYKLAAGINISASYFKKRLFINAGFRADHFSVLGQSPVFSPRFGVTYKISPLTSLNASAGINFQSPEMLWILVDADNRNLKYIRMDQFVLSAEHFLSYDIKLTIEPYLKQYYNYPVSVYDPNFIFINSGVEIYPNFLDKAVSIGKGYFAGIDIMLQKKNTGAGAYWTISYSYTKSEFLALKGGVQPAEFDYGNQVTLIAGYKMPFGLSISGKFRFAKGRPYTPFDLEASVNNYRGIYDEERYNKERLPDYARLDLRLEYCIKWQKAALSAYIEVLNVLGRENFYNYFWSGYYRRIKANLQLPRVPIVGISIKF